MKNKSRIVIAVTLAIMMMLSSVLTSFAATNHYIPDEYGNIDVINENIPEYEDNEFLGEENDEKATYSLVKSLSDLDESKNYILVTQDGTSNKTFGDGETINKAYVALTSKDSFDEEGKTYLPWYTIKADGSDNKLPEKIEIPSEEKDSLLWNIQINQDSPKTCILFCDNGNLVADIDSLKVEKETTATELNYSESSNSFSLTISSENRINTSGSRRAFRCNNTSTSSFYLFEESSEETESYTVTVTCGENGTVTPGTIELEKGESQQFTIEAATDYEIDDVKLDGTSVKASVSSGKYTVSNITADHTLAVTFRVKQETTDAERVDSVVTGKYVIVSEGNFALSQAVHLGYLNQNSYEYLGYYGKSVTITNDKIELSSLTKDLVWDISESGGKLTIKNLEGKVLGATYQSNGLSDNSQKGTLATGIDDTWTLSSGILKSDKSGKSLRYDKDSDHVSSDQIREGKANLFTIRSTGGTIEFYKIADKNVSEIDDINNVTVKTEVSPDEGGTVTPAGSISLIKGSDVKFTFDSNTGFRLSKVEDGTTDVTNEVDANAYVKSSVSENTTVKATFELEVTKYKVAFDLNGHGSNAPQTVETGNDGKVSKPSPDPTDASYDFGGWYKEATCQNEWNFATDTASEDTTLYAKWTLKQDEATYIVFTSDVHNKVKGESLSRLSTILNNLKSKGIDFDYLGFCGDMGDAQVSEDNFWNYASQVMDLVEKSGITGIYTTGNHEYSPGNIDRTSNQTAKRYIRNAEAVSKDQFSIYCLGAASGTQEITTAQIDALSAYLSTHKTLPVFVMSHYPLHSAKEGFETRNTGNAGQVITLLNQYPNVIFLWGHNHTLSDPKYDITDFSDINGAEINFKYMAAGCLSDSEYGAGSASVEGKALLVKIENGKMTFSYIDDAEDVPPTPVTKGDFKRSTSKAITAGNQYLFVGQSGSSETTFYALKNETLETSKSSSQKHTLTNLKSLADSFSLTSDEESAGIIWTAESVSGGYVLSNDGKYLANSTDNTVTLTTDKNNAKVFTNLSSVKYGGGINTTYYFNYSSGDSEAYIYEKTGDAPSPGTTYTITATAGSHGAVSPESKTVNEGEDATFTITPDTGYEIDTVTVDGAAVTPTTDTTYKFTDVRAEHTLNVTFKEIYVPIPQYTITATAGANGKVSPESKTVNEGEDATFTITPDTGYEIDTVTVDGAAVTPTSDTTYKFTDVRAEHTLRVTFKEIYVPIPQYTITATAGPNGAVSPSSKTVNEGEDATFTITPDTGYEVDQITVDGSEVTYSGGSTYTFTDVDKNHTLRVTFKEIYVPIPQYKITATAGANGKVSPESKTVNEGEDATFTITPDTGYEIDTVTVDGAAVTPTSDTTYKFTDVRAEHTLNVTFKETIEHVTGVTLDKISLTLTEGTTETLTATVTPFKAANKNVTWKSGDETVATIDAGGMVTAVAEGTTNITVTTEDGGYTAECNITVNAAPPVPEIKYTVTFDSDGGSDISSQTVKSGEKAIKPYNPTKSNYRFDYWYTGSATTKAYDFETPVTSDITLKAHWTYSGGSHSGGGSSGGGSTTANRTSTKYPVNTAVTPVTTSSDGKTQLMGTAIIGMRWDSLPTGVMPTAGTWSLGRDGYSYLKNNGQKAINEWDYIVLKTGYGSLFYFDENGIMVTGWKQIGGKWYFFNYENNDYLGALMVGPGKSLDGYSLSADGSWTGY